MKIDRHHIVVETSAVAAFHFLDFFSVDSVLAQTLFSSSL